MPPNTRLVTECLSLLSLNLLSRLKRRRGAYLSFLSQSAFFFATTRHGWKALTAQQQQIHRALWSGFCGQVRI
jgi:Tfp pilus assembly protein PilN